MLRKETLLVLALALTACSEHRTAIRSSYWNPDITVAGRSAEVWVHDLVLANDNLVKGQMLYEPRFFTLPDAKGGYVVMTSAFGNEKSCGPRYTWLFHFTGNHWERIFRYPFDAIALESQSGNPVIRGNYWAYECTVCDDPRNGYMAQIPVRVSKKGKGWRIVPELASDRREFVIREARLIIQSAQEKYGQNDPEALRMAQQLARFFPPEPVHHPPKVVRGS